MAKKPAAEYMGTLYEHTTPLRAIRAKCLDCSAGLPGEVRKCPCKTCSLWPFRMKKNPFISRGEGDEFDPEDIDEMDAEELGDLLAEVNGEDDEDADDEE